MFTKRKFGSRSKKIANPLSSLSCESGWSLFKSIPV